MLSFSHNACPSGPALRRTQLCQSRIVLARRQLTALLNQTSSEASQSVSPSDCFLLKHTRLTIPKSSTATQEDWVQCSGFHHSDRKGKS